MNTCTATSKNDPEHPNTDAGTTIGNWEYQLWVDLGGASLTGGECGELSKKCEMKGEARAGIVCRPAGDPPGTEYRQASGWQSHVNYSEICQEWHGNNDCSGSQGEPTWSVSPGVDPQPTNGQSDTKFGVDVKAACNDTAN